MAAVAADLSAQANHNPAGTTTGVTLHGDVGRGLALRR
jgi:hypothetical protein